jgi:hypothetical protein
MEQGFRYEKDCLSKKEETTCIGNGNSGYNSKLLNVKRARKRDQGHGNLLLLHRGRFFTLLFGV